MLQIGIISDRIDTYTYKVRIPIYDKVVDDPTSVNTEDLPEAVISAVPGMTYGLAVNDRVIIGFLNDELDKRVILGQLSRDTDSSSETVHSEVESQIQAVNTAIDILNDKDVYTHAKFSDDGGKTFTTLFDVSNIEDNGDTCSSIKELNIGKSKRVNWSIILDGVSVDKDRFPITTYLTMGDITKSFNSYDVEVPDEFITGLDIYLSYDIAMSYEDIMRSDVALTTDLISLGVSPGDYLGICVDNNRVDSVIPNDYTWIPLSDAIDIIISRVGSSLSNQIKINAKLLFGNTWDWGAEDKSDGTGYADALSVLNSSLVLKKGELRFQEPAPAVVFGSYRWQVNPGSGHLSLLR